MPLELMEPPRLDVPPPNEVVGNAPDDENVSVYLVNVHTLLDRQLVAWDKHNHLLVKKPANPLQYTLIIGDYDDTFGNRLKDGFSIVGVSPCLIDFMHIQDHDVYFQKLGGMHFGLVYKSSELEAGIVERDQDGLVQVIDGMSQEPFIRKPFDSENDELALFPWQAHAHLRLLKNMGERQKTSLMRETAKIHNRVEDLFSDDDLTSYRPFDPDHLPTQYLDQIAAQHGK